MTREEAVQKLAAAMKEAEAEDRRYAWDALAPAPARLSKGARVADLLIRYLPGYGLALVDDAGEALT